MIRQQASVSKPVAAAAALYLALLASKLKVEASLVYCKCC